MSPISSEAVEQTLPMKRLRQIISLGALLFVLAHLFWPVLKIDSITVCLIVIAILPWISPLVKSLELPGGWKLEFAEISKHIIEENVPSSKREKLTRHQVVSSQTWDRGYYKLYSNGTFTQRFKLTIKAGSNQSDFVLPIAFPNEATSIEVLGDLAVKVVELSSSKVSIRHQPQFADMEVTILVTGL